MMDPLGLALDLKLPYFSSAAELPHLELQKDPSPISDLLKLCQNDSNILMMSQFLQAQ